MISVSSKRTRALVTRVLAIALLPTVAAVAEAQREGGIKYVYTVDYPHGQKDAYLEWVASMAETIQAPDEIRRVASYDNYYASSPHRIIEFEFDDMAAAASYFERPEIQRLFDELVNRGINVGVMVLQRRGDYRPGAESGAVKFVHTVDYPLGQKESYIRWVASIADALQQASGVKQVTSFDNYFGAQPHRIIEYEFDDMVTAARYFEQPEIRRVWDEAFDHGINRHMWVLRLLGDYRQR